MRAIGSGSGRFDDVFQQKIRKLVEGLGLDDPEAEVNKPGSDQLTLRMHQEDSRGIVLWAYLRPFVTEWVKIFPHEKNPPPLEDIEKAIAIALDEPVFFLTQELIKRHLDDKPPLPAGELAEINSKRNTPAWHKFKKRIGREFVDPLGDPQLWNVERIFREDKNGGGAVADTRFRLARL
jgi:hypothetical protein